MTQEQIDDVLGMWEKVDVTGGYTLNPVGNSDSNFKGVDLKSNQIVTSNVEVQDPNRSHVWFRNSNSNAGHALYVDHNTNEGVFSQRKTVQLPSVKLLVTP